MLEWLGLISFISIVIVMTWRISVKNRTLFESPVFKTFLPLFVIVVLSLYIFIVLLKYNPIQVSFGVISLGVLAGIFGYLQMPVESSHFIAHLKIAAYDIAPKGAWIEVGDIIGEVISLKMAAITLKDVEGALYTIENGNFLDMSPRRLETTQMKKKLTNVFMYTVHTALPLVDRVNFIEVKDRIRSEIIKKQMKVFSDDTTTPDGEEVDSAGMTGFVFDKTGTHISPRTYFTVECNHNGVPYIDMATMIPCKDYYDGWSKWHSFVGKSALKALEDVSP